MEYYYITVQSKAHALLLELRLRNERISCELTYTPREITSDLCSMSVRLIPQEYEKAKGMIGYLGIPGILIYKSVISSRGAEYSSVKS